MFEDTALPVFSPDPLSPGALLPSPSLDGDPAIAPTTGPQLLPLDDDLPLHSPAPNPMPPIALDAPLLGSAAVLADGSDPLIAPSAPAAAAVEALWQEALAELETFVAGEGWQDSLELAFGDEWSDETAETVLFGLIDGALQPDLVVLPLAELGSYGAFSASHNTVFLAAELLPYSAAATTVLLEELGHWVDAHLNANDSPGDEGARFAALVQQQPLTPLATLALYAEDDSTTLQWQGQTLAVEQADGGTFTVNASGQITVEFVFDAGLYTGQLGIYSTAGMDDLVLGSPDYIAEAARRVLSNSTEGYVVVADGREGASLSGTLGEANQNSGTAAGPKTFTLQPGDTVALMLVPDGSFEAVLTDPGATGSLQPLFSIDAANPDGSPYFGALSSNANGLVLGVEDVQRSLGSDGDFNDLIVQIEGLTGTLADLNTLVAAEETWQDSELGQTLFALEPGPLDMGVDPAIPNPSDPSDPSDPSSPIDPTDPGNPTVPPVTGGLLVDISTDVVKFDASATAADLIALDAPSVSIGTQTIYIGTNQVSGNNQDPIIISVDSANPANNWVRTDYEVTGTDGRGTGLAWTGTDLYAFFTVDGTQGSPAEDFRRAADDADQAWLRSYGQGGGAKVSVIGRIDPATGELLDAAYLSAVLENGNSNTLTITGLTVNASGNLVISADSFFSPRSPDGSPLTQVGTGSSPFAYTIEITPDLKQVVSTSADGWV